MRTNPYLAAALAADAAGLSVLPPKQDGSKRPDAVTWTAYFTPDKETGEIKRETPETLAALYANGRTGVGAVMGAASGNVELFDFDDRETYRIFKEAAENTGLGDLVARVESGYSERTPHGVHWYWYCNEIEGNKKLAQRPKRPEEMKDDKDKVKTLIETRGQRGYSIMAPSNGKVHPDGLAYTVLAGNVAEIVTVTPEERKLLLDLARSCDQMPINEPHRVTATTPGSTPGERPGDIYNQRATWEEILGPHGWTYIYSRGEAHYWRRPGKDCGISASINHTGKDTLIVFSTSTPFEISPKSYDKFGAYACLEHNNDLVAAGKALHAAGYRKPEPEVVDDDEDEGDEGSFAETASEKPEKPTIKAGARFVNNVAADLLRTLEQANGDNPRLFVRAGELAHIRRDEHGRPAIQALTKDGLMVRAARAARWTRWDARSSKDKEASPPDDALRYVMARGDWPFPALAGLTEVPVLRPDGSILTTPGYDPFTKLVYTPAASLRVPPIPEVPTAEDVSRARALLDDVIVDFPFDNPASRANALALLITPIIRSAISGPVPLALIDKNVPGAGATLLAEAIGMIALGRTPGMTAAPKDDEECEKRITTLLRDGETLVIFDNVDRPLDYSSLSLALTVGEWVGRILGRSESARYPNRAAWIATGVNLNVRGDIARRAYQIRMIAAAAQPWRSEGETDRFRHPDLIGWVGEQRGALVAAVLTLARAWFAAGRPRADVPRLGKYEAWCETIGGILAIADVEGFLGNLDQLYEQVDAEAPEWATFLRAWHTHYRATPITPTELTRTLRQAESVPIFEEGPTTAALLREALPSDLADTFANPRISFERALGRALAKRADRRYADDGLRLRRGGTTGRSLWRVVVDHSEPAGPSPTQDEAAEPAGYAGYAGYSPPKQERCQSETPHTADSCPGTGESNPHNPHNPQAAGEPRDGWRECAGCGRVGREDLCQFCGVRYFSTPTPPGGAEGADRCYACKGSVFWESGPGRRLCATCHPPTARARERMGGAV